MNTLWTSCEQTNVVQPHLTGSICYQCPNTNDCLAIGTSQCYYVLMHIYTCENKPLMIPYKWKHLHEFQQQRKEVKSAVQMSVLAVQMSVLEYSKEFYKTLY